MPTLIPFQPSIANYRFSCTLDGIPFVFRVRWNDAAASLAVRYPYAPGAIGPGGIEYSQPAAGDVPRAGWYIDILDAQESAIRNGIRVVLGLPLGYICRDPRRPPGILLPVDTSGADLDPGFDDLGARVQVWFVTWAEIGQMQADLR